MKKVWRWAKRITLGVIAFTVLAIGITLGTLHTDWGRTRLRNIVVDQLQSTFPGSTIGRIEGSVFGDLILRDVTIMARDHRPLATVKTLTIEAALLPLIGKTAHVESVIAEDVVVYVRSQPEEPKPAPAAPSEPSAWSVELPAIEVHRGRVVFEEHGEVIDHVEAGVSLAVPAGRPLSAAVTAKARWRGEPIAIDAIVQSGDVVDVPYAVASLGGAGVVVASAHIDGLTIDGAVSAHAPAALVKKLTEVELPGDVAVIAKRSKTGGVELSGHVGAASVHVLAATDLDTLTAKAIISAEVPDVAALSDGALEGEGTAVATLVASPERVDGMVGVVGASQGTAGSALIAVDATLDRARVLVAAQTDQPPSRLRRQDQKIDLLAWRLRRLGGSIVVERTGEQWSLRESTFDAHATSKQGDVTASLTASGPLTPEPSVAVTGTVDGRRIRYDDLSVARVRTRFAATDIPRRPTGTAQIDVTGAQQGTVKIPVATLGARGVMHEDGVIEIDLERHRVRTTDGSVWAGTGGHVRVTDESIAITKVATGSGRSRVTAQATLGRTSDALTAKVTARQLRVAMIDPKLAGTLAADIDVARKGGLWTGTATVDANQVVLPDRPVLDGKLAVKIDKRRVTARATASNPAIGGATLELDVIGPRDITDAGAWKRLERSSIQSVRVALSKIDASKLGASGSLDGELAISASGAGGRVDVRGVVTEVGTIDSQLALGAADKGEILAHGTLHLGGVDPVDIDATLALPIHPFDPAGWEQLGRATLREATIQAKRIAFDPELMKRFGVDSPWRGWAATKIKIGAGARTSEFVLDIHELRDGGTLTKPVEIHLTGGSDAAGVHAQASVRTDKIAVELAAKSPLSFEAMLEGRARSAPIEATLTVPSVAAREVALLIGRQDVLGGTLAGSIRLGGTIETPTARAQLVATNLSVAAGVASKPPTVEKLELDARWHGDRFELELTGHETGGRLLKISARGQPDSLDSIVASIEAANFDIAPFMAFAPPGPLVGTRGLVSGVLKLRGLDPEKGDVRGRLVITEARIPIAAELGTLRDGTFEINVVKKEIVALIDGKLGKGTVKGKAIARLTGSMPTAAELSLALRKVSLIGELQPVIDADVAGWFARTRTKWTGKITVKNGYVFVPPEGGSELLVAGAPADIVFIDAQPIVIKPKRKPPTKPWLIADVDIARTKVVVDDVDFNFDAIASGQLKLTLGEGGIGLDGAISTERGNVEIVGRRYRLDHGVVDFDGTLDPRLDIRMMHDFKTLTLVVDIMGRSSSPDLRLSSDTGSYSQGQLFGFLAGGTPSDDPSVLAGSGEAVAGGSLTLLSRRLGRRLSKRLPLLKFDTINYEAKTASSSGAIRFGKRIGEHTYLLFRQRFEPQLDENRSEVVVEHELRSNVIVEGAAGEVGGGLDLLWRKRW